MGDKREHRRPPLPEWFHHVTGGVCRWCGHLIWKNAETVNTRRLWHPECLKPYWIVTDPQTARRCLYERDKGVCAKCGKYDEDWECDHIVRLVDAPRELKYWTLENMQTLCSSCHDAKTAAENSKTVP